MSSGILSIEVIINGIKYHLDGQFHNGKIISGLVKYDNVELYGTFNSSMLLHGFNCQKKKGSRVFSGTFVDGLLVDGSITEKGKIKEIGQYEKEYLIHGMRYTDDCRLSGTFRYQHLTNGIIHFADNTTHIGKFDYENKLLVGTIMSPNGFTANVEFNSNRTLVKAFVNYSGDITKLSKEQLIMYCCSGPDTELVSKVYNKYFSQASCEMLLMLRPEMFDVVDITDKMGIDMIIRNLSKNRPTYVPAEIITDPVNLLENDKYEKDH